GNVSEPNGSYIITFSWTAEGPTGGPTCETTIVAYKTDLTGGGADRFSDTDNDIVADDSDNGLQTASAGIGGVDSSGIVIQDENGQSLVISNCGPSSCGAVDDGTDDVCGRVEACRDKRGNVRNVCRDAGGQCDLAETCTGNSGACPGD